MVLPPLLRPRVVSGLGNRKNPRRVSGGGVREVGRSRLWSLR